MKRNVFVVGYPRTATTRLYDVLRKYTDLWIYEPFNPSVVDDIRRGIHIHDVVGRIKHSYNKLPRKLYDTILRNTSWAEPWSNNYERPRTPYLGYYWRWILDQLLLHIPYKQEKNVLIKDVYAWPYLQKLVTMYKNTLFIVPVRNMEYVYRSFLNWYKNRHPITWFIRRITGYQPRRPFTNVDEQVSIVSSKDGVIDRIKRIYRNRVELYRSLSPKTMMGIGVFYKYFYGKVPRFYPVFFLGHRLLRKMVYKTYSIYRDTAYSLNKVHNNILVVGFEKYLTREQIIYIENKVREWLKDEA